MTVGIFKNKYNKVRISLLACHTDVRLVISYGNRSSIFLHLRDKYTIHKCKYYILCDNFQ